MMKLAVFDMDGTILNTLEDLTEALNYALLRAGLPPHSADDVRTYLGDGIRVTISRAVPAGTPPACLAAIYSDLTGYYAAHMLDHTRPYPGIPGMLNTLLQADVRTAVVSNKSDPAAKKLAAAFFPGQFHAVQGLLPHVPRKPAPDSVRMVLETLQISPGSTVYIGDSETDLLTAQNAGLRCIAVSWGFRSREQLEAAGAPEIADDPADIPVMLQD